MKIENVFIASSSYFESKRDWGPQGIALSDIVTAIKMDMHADDDGLHITPQRLKFDMGIGSVSIADASIGSFGLNDVDLSQMSLVVSGHP